MAKKDILRESLDDLIGDDNLMPLTTDDTEGLPPMKPVQDRDYVSMKSNAQAKATKTIDSLMRFYLSQEIIEDEEYIRAKKRIDEMTLSSLIFQLEAGEKALVTLLETIDSGELAPRMFEVLATLQKSMLDIIKSQTMYLMAAEEGTKRIARDIDIYTDKSNKKLTTGQNQSGNVVRGTKDLMRGIQDDINPDEIEDIEPVD
tara:strand:+ start:6499 stop:7104 length:606 start_codon:yes stop_codon:yes gene_type:complete